MAVLRIPDEQRLLRADDEIRDYLASIGIEYQRWELPADVSADASADQILSAHAPQIDELKRRGGYVTADVIDVNPDTSGLEAMLAKFNVEHRHDEDEVRYIVAGRGLFHIHPQTGPIVALEVEAGDLIRVPRGTRHWFDLCDERRIRAIRLFQDVSGWTPHYTNSGVDRGYEPVCWGPRYIPPQTVARQRAAPVDGRLVRVVLLDIEGTTTPVDFVYHTLFPYAGRRVEAFLLENSHKPEIQSLLQDLQVQHRLDATQGSGPPELQSEPAEARLRSMVAYIQWLISKDSKCTALKSLQGKIWQQGFVDGELHGQVYPDVPRALERWRRQNREISIYSSGSVLAQQLLFRTVASGDLTPHIAGFFDTQIGMKSAAESYKKIAASSGCAPRECLFISDAAKEVEAAQAAGMQAVLCDRDQHAPALPGAPASIPSFDEIFPD
jgi:1,2-dihydroxy-3-keto-5-methylthiopentene dioxygenase